MNTQIKQPAIDALTVRSYDDMVDDATVTIEEAVAVLDALRADAQEGSDSLPMIGAIRTLLLKAIPAVYKYRDAMVAHEKKGLNSTVTEKIPERGEGGEITFTPQEAMDVYMEILECGGAIEGVGEAIHTLGGDAFMQNMGSAVSKLAKDLMQGDAIMPLHKWANEKFEDEDQ